MSASVPTHLKSKALDGASRSRSLSEEGQKARCHFYSCCHSDGSVSSQRGSIIGKIPYNAMSNECSPATSEFMDQAYLMELSALNDCPYSANNRKNEKSFCQRTATDSSSSSYYVSYEPSYTGEEENSKYPPEAFRERPYEGFDTQLKMSARCDEDRCDHAPCNQIKTLLSDIQKPWAYPMNTLKSIHLDLLVAIYKHYEGCDSPRCPLYWCHSHLNNNFPKTLSREGTISAIRQKIINLVEMMDVPPFHLGYHQFLKFDKRISFEVVPPEDKLWTRLCMVGHSSKTMLVKPYGGLVTEPRQFWVVKNVLNPKNSHSWDVYTRLAQLEDVRSVTPLLWAVSLTNNSSNYIVCSALEGPSLHEYLQESKALSCELVVKIMLQLTAALAQLHTLGIVYLNWTSKNILVLQDQRNVKLINFDSSTTVGSTKDAGSLLPVHLLSPELLAEGDVDLASDLWGMGCLLYELTTLKPVWHQYRHDTVEELKELMIKQRHPSPPISDSYTDMRPLFDICWKVDPKEREDVGGLHNLLIKYCTKPQTD